MSDVDILQVGVGALKSVATAALLFAWAAYLATRGFFDQTFLSRLANVAKVMFIPCTTIDALGNGMDLDFLRKNWFLVVAGNWMLLVGMVYGHFLVKCLDIPPNLKPWYTLAVAVPNMVALPLVLVEAICREEVDSKSEVAECIAEGTLRLFTVCLTNSVITWVFLYDYVLRYNEPAPGQTARLESSDAQAEQQLEEKSSTDEPPAAGAPGGGGGGDPAFLKITPKVVGSASSPWECSTAAGSDQGSDTPASLESGVVGEARTGERSSRLKRSYLQLQEPESECVEDASPASESPATATPTPQGGWRQKLELVMSPPVVASVVAMPVALVPAVHDLFYSHGAPLSFIASGISVASKASPGAMNLVSGGSFGLQLLNFSWDDPLGLRVLGISRRTMLLLIVSRIVIVPLLNLLTMAPFATFLPEDRWSRLVLCFQPAGVTANVITAMAQLMGQSHGAQLIALAALPQMLLYVPVSACLIAMGMSWNSDLS
eukprot:TRINITY_DN53251_c0_g1_i1.p1 TRINITY_DN53251_c0_g1~~TRINITY_DN53251_c0_g1_i1.p1  ORF type:complete len:489 (+),score=99.90 TRINITY_DN53251_c0_g1_i1:100-1566(+)